MEVGFLIQFLNDAAHQQMAFMEAPENIEQKYAIFAGGLFMPSACDLLYEKTPDSLCGACKIHVCNKCRGISRNAR